MAINGLNLKYASKMQDESPEFRKFARGISTENTKSDYTGYIRYFLELNQMPDQYEKAAKLEKDELDTMFEKYIDSMEDSGCKTATIRTRLAGVEKFFIMNDCDWHKDRIRLSIKKDNSLSGGTKPITTDDIQSMLMCTKSLRVKAMVHFLASTGIRPGALTDPVLMVNDLVPMPHPTNPSIQKYCYAISIYANSKENYWAFLTSEATSIVDKYLESRKINGEVFGPKSVLFITKKTKSVKVKHVTSDNLRYIIGHLFRQSGINRSKISNTRYDKSLIYGFRKRFNTILKLNNDVNSNIAEKLMAHKRGLDGTYLQPTREECYAEFVKAIPELTIDSTQRQKVDLQKKQEKIDELSNKNKVIATLQSRVDEQAEKMKEWEQKAFLYKNFPEA